MLRVTTLAGLPKPPEPRGYHHKPQMLGDELLDFVFTLMDFGLMLTG